MCMEDVRIMRRTTVSGRTLSLTGASIGSQIVLRDERRIMIHIGYDTNAPFSIESVATIGIGPREAFATHFGIPIKLWESIKWNLLYDGSIVFGPLYLYGLVTDGYLTIIETFLAE